ncbi:MAG: hypothetical protein L3K13_06350 [Thermoplasmata archaeon]|nr:hypothetical protein [Thermoplasmata archaeon]
MGSRGRAGDLRRLLGLGLLVVVPLLFGVAGSAPTVASAGAGARLSTLGMHLAPLVPSANITGVTLGISTSSPAICLGATGNCPIQTGIVHVSLSAVVGSGTISAWPAVQLLFVLETTPYDGVYDPSAGVPGGDPCGDAQYGYGPLCEESNGIPFFVANAGAIASSIAAAHRYTNMSFGLVDYFATGDQFDTGGGAYYHVDVPNFLNRTSFPSAVASSFQAKTLGGGFILPHSDLRQNFLHSSSITALYGALEGAGLNWSAGAHHVVVLIDSTAPRDSHYPENYCVSPAVTPAGLTSCLAPSCEPPNLLPGGIFVPECEGWVKSNTSNASADIGALALQAPLCVSSFGANCTIDAINLYGTPTDPGSPSWAESGGSGGPANWTADARSILHAGCDIASATGGSWDGPNWYTCANGPAGTLRLVNHGSAGEPNVTNPSLLASLKNVSVGDPGGVFPAAGNLNHPMFLFVPYGSISVAPNANFVEHCTNATGVVFPCEGPTRFSFGETTAYGWNVSSSPITNGLRAGDSWSATFDIEVLAPPYGTVPIDACITLECRVAGSGPILGNYTDSRYRAYEGSLVTALSFPIATIEVQPDSFGFGPAPPGAPVGGIPVGTPGAGGTPPPTTAPPPSAAVPTPAVAVQSITAGTIAAGAIRLGIRGASVDVKTATPAAAKGKKKKRSTSPTYLGHWE